mgnify:FL=1
MKIQRRKTGVKGINRGLLFAQVHHPRHRPEFLLDELFQAGPCSRIVRSEIKFEISNAMSEKTNGAYGESDIIKELAAR